MSAVVLILLFIALTLVVHSIMARVIGPEAERLGLNRTRWTIFILIGGIPAWLCYRAARNDALRRLESGDSS